MQNFLNSLLKQRKHNDLYRTRQVHSGIQSPTLLIDGNQYLSFCSNDYLGLASDLRLKNTWQIGAKKYGIGSGASHLITGHTSAHHSLELELAKYTKRERALLFSTGYMANLGVVTTLLGRHDAVFLDKLNHASLVDAAQLSQAKMYRYSNLETLEHKLVNTTAKHKLIITDGVFSMDGNIVNLPKIVELAKIHNAWVMVDDAHGLGVIGKTGRGTVELYDFGVEEVPILMGTLGKAFGVFGAFVAGSELLIETLIQSARSYIYTTALPPALVDTIRTSLVIVEAENWRRQHLCELITYFRNQASNLPLMESSTPIQPIILGSSAIALKASKLLYERGIIVTAIRPPTVPKETARLRITLSALHSKEQIDKLIKALNFLND
ncbi:8-amino-7-oxononanoate synthase [Thiotrichales bacterium HSG1]|nr:8-amino-7-oxononanoate synthase [Thiotrichales bacterium HSG1]